MEKFLDLLIDEFKKIKRVRGDLFTNFLSFVQLILTDKKDDKYKELSTKIVLLEHKLEEMYKIVKRLQTRAGL